MAESVGVSSKQDDADEKKYFLKVLDDIVSLNSLFSVALFIGLSFTLPGLDDSLEENQRCHPEISIRKRLVYSEITSFSFFVFSAITAKTVKLLIYVYHKDSNAQRRKLIEIPFYFSIYGTMGGCVLLVQSMVDVVQIKLGRLPCRSRYSIYAVLTLVLFIGLAMLAYLISVTYGLFFKKEAKDVTTGLLKFMNLSSEIMGELRLLVAPYIDPLWPLSLILPMPFSD